MAEIGKAVETRVKGTAFLGTLKNLKASPRGRRGLEKVLAEVSPATAKIFSRKILAIMEYPYASFVEFILAADKAMGKGDLHYCREMGRITARIDVETVYNFYKKRARVEDLARDCDVIWKSYYVNAGRMKAEDVSPDHTLVRISDFPAMHPAHCRLMEGWMIEAILGTGGEWVEEIREVQCQSKGGPYHEFLGRWRQKG